MAPVPRSFCDRVKAAVHWWLEWDWLTMEQLVDWLLGRECAPVKRDAQCLAWLLAARNWVVLWLFLSRLLSRLSAD